ncbi:hypothetical protein RIF29_24265 [Crotalaria pallida]|uniref:O-methyltransferase n=1 Tax=Crotalaria pallida TaxID=3830 RepID=A0AAN9HWE7_CROPI
MDFNTNCSEESELHQAQIHLYKYAYNFISSMALKSAIELGIADVIHNHGKPITVPELVSSLKLHPSKINVLHRFMRLLTHNGFFAKTKVEGKEEEAYILTPPSKLLIRSEPTCLSPFVMVVLQPNYIEQWRYSKTWLNEDKELTLTESVTGKSLWDSINEDPDRMRRFQESMAADSYMFKLALKECKHVFEGLGSLVDVGGCTGDTTRLIHEAFPHMKCIVFDQPHVVANCSGTQNNLSFVGGDMLKSIPSADAILLKRVLHDWDDESSLNILKNCKEAISGEGKKGKVIIIDITIDEKSDDLELTKLKLNIDMVMLSLVNGKERQKKEWEKLIYEAGFSHYRIAPIPICGIMSLIEVYP